jgi:hypothetical protein
MKLMDTKTRPELNQAYGKNLWLLPAIMGITFVPLGVYLVKSFRNK